MRDGTVLLIFTDLDGTLLNQDDYDYRAALPQLEQLKAQKIPVIPVTSKTRLEVEHLCREIGLSDPFIVENGSGVFVPTPDPRFEVPDATEWGDYGLLQLGCTYQEARQGLQAVATQLGEPLQGFGDLTEAEIAHLTGLDPEATRRAKAREFTEPFVTPKQISTAHLEQAIATQGFRVVVGDRFSHLIGPEAGKGRAVQQVIAAYRPIADTAVTTVGLGNSPNDVEMLEVVDIPIVVPGARGVHPELANRGWTVAPVPGSQGWAKAIAAIQAHRQTPE